MDGLAIAAPCWESVDIEPDGAYRAVEETALHGRP
jgi:hypothetical protein